MQLPRNEGPLLTPESSSVGCGDHVNWGSIFAVLAALLVDALIVLAGVFAVWYWMS